MKSCALELDRASASMIRGIVLSKRLSALAKKARLKSVRLRTEDKDELAKLTAGGRRLKRQLDTTRAYRPQAGAWLENIRLKANGVEPIVMLVDPQPRKRYGSIIQRADDGTVVGGFTLQAVANATSE